MSSKKIFRGFGTLLVAMSLFVVLPGLYYRYKLATVNATPLIPVNVPSLAKSFTQQTITGKASQLSVPSLNMTVPVVDGAYDPTLGRWTLGNDTASYATLSTPPNNLKGMTYLYGRCRPSVFGQLKNIQSGAEANVKTNNGYMFSYKLREKHDVKPEDTKLFSYGGNPILVLQTCSGIWSQNRQQFTFDFVKYEKQ